MAATWDYVEGQICRDQRLGNPLRMMQRHDLVRVTMKDVNGAVDADRVAIQHLMGSALVNQSFGNWIGVVFEFGRPIPDTVLIKRLALVCRKVRQHQFAGKIRRRCDQHQARNTLRIPLHEVERHPGAHGRPDDRHAGPTEIIQDEFRIAKPIADGAIREGAAAEPVAAIIEARKGPTGLKASFMKKFRLAAIHVGVKPTAEQHFALRPQTRDIMTACLAGRLPVCDFRFSGRAGDRLFNILDRIAHGHAD